MEFDGPNPIFNISPIREHTLLQNTTCYVLLAWTSVSTENLRVFCIVLLESVSFSFTVSFMSF